jgi:hypothetical protein
VFRASHRCGRDSERYSTFVVHSSPEFLAGATMISDEFSLPLLALLEVILSGVAGVGENVVVTCNDGVLGCAGGVGGGGRYVRSSWWEV